MKIIFIGKIKYFRLKKNCEITEWKYIGEINPDDLKEIEYEFVGKFKKGF